MKIPKNAKVKKMIVEIRAKVQVTQDDIKRGVEGQFGACAVARALKRLFSEKVVLVWSHRIRVGEFRDCKVPRKVGNFIVKFDRDKKSVKPFSFVINLNKI